MTSLVDDVKGAIKEAKEEGVDVNDLLKGRTYISDAGGMMITYLHLDIDKKEVSYTLTWRDGDQDPRHKKSLDSDYFKQDRFLRDYSENPEFPERHFIPPKNPRWAVDIGD